MNYSFRCSLTGASWHPGLPAFSSVHLSDFRDVFRSNRTGWSNKTRDARKTHGWLLVPADWSFDEAFFSEESGEESGTQTEKWTTWRWNSKGRKDGFCKIHLPFSVQDQLLFFSVSKTPFQNQLNLGMNLKYRYFWWSMIVDRSGHSPPIPKKKYTANPRWDGADSGFQPPGQPVRFQDLDLDLG